MEGVVPSLGPGLRLAEEAELSLGWYGYVDESDDISLCDEEGETESGEVVDEVFAGVVAIVKDS